MRGINGENFMTLVHSGKMTQTIARAFHQIYVKNCCTLG
jgi:hypothetical protein